MEFPKLTETLKILKSYWFIKDFDEFLEILNQESPFFVLYYTKFTTLNLLHSINFTQSYSGFLSDKLVVIEGIARI